MTTRKPLVMVNGLQQELPAGDDPSLAFLAALGQILGDTSANILEIETATKAARVVYQPSAGGAREVNFDICHYRAGVPVNGNATTAAINGAEMMTMANTQGGAIGILRKVTAGMNTSAVAGARIGLCAIQMFEIFGVYNMSGSTAIYILPPFGGGSDGAIGVTADYCSLNSRQNQPQLRAQRSTGGVGVPSYSGIGQGQNFNTIFGTAKTAVGANIPPTVLFDHQVNGPFVMTRGSGFSVTYSSPAAVTSQSINGFVNWSWDEWQIKTPAY
jgi:hypothetical protein